MAGKLVKKAIHSVHLYLGLLVGIPFFLIALSGAVYTWEPELATFAYHQVVQERDGPFAPVSKFRNTLSNEFPEGDFRAVVYRGRDRAAEVLVFAPGTYYHAFFDPYTGGLLHLQDMKEGWLNHLKGLHRNLLLGDMGREIVHWVTLTAFLLVVSGLVLWWPHRRTRRDYHFTIPWRQKPLMLNYNLHKVLGFYASWIGICAILTGMFWGFESIRQVFRGLTMEDSLTYDNPESDPSLAPAIHDLDHQVDSLAFLFIERHPDKYVRINYPHKDVDPIIVDLIPRRRTVYDTDHHYFDQYSGHLLNGSFKNGTRQSKSSFMVLNELVYDVHLGNVGNFPGRLLVCLTSLLLASLPITGFIIWYGKRNS